MRWCLLGLAAPVVALCASAHAAPRGMGAGPEVAAATAAADGAPDPPPRLTDSESGDEPEATPPSSTGGKSASFLGGVYLTVFGGASMIGGLLYTTAGPGEYCPNCASSQYTALGYVALIGGFVAATTGGVLIILGSRDNPGEDAVADAAPAVSLGPGRATLRFSF